MSHVDLCFSPNQGALNTESTVYEFTVIFLAHLSFSPCSFVLCGIFVGTESSANCIGLGADRVEFSCRGRPTL